ncbi:MAG: hypothetical protein ACRDY0_03875 [Acidimicrobiales bacterium]
MIWISGVPVEPAPRPRAPVAPQPALARLVVPATGTLSILSAPAGAV